MSERRVTKVRRTKTGRIEVRWQVELEPGKWDDLSLDSHDPPRGELHEVFDELRDHVVAICEIGVKPGLVVVTGVSLTYSDELGRWAVITAQQKLKRSRAPLNLNTPHKWDDHEDELQALPPATVEALDRLFLEALEYVRGNRSQRSLFD